MNVKNTIDGDLEALRAAIAGQVSIPGQASYGYYDLEETPVTTAAVLSPASFRRLQEIMAAYDLDQVIISAHPVWQTRS